jgi:signal transduction histidine kinase
MEVGVTASARVIYQLGEQLIADEFVALNELIKNAYDADAVRVKINVDTKAETPYGKGQIIVDDNGNGMTQGTLLRSFLRVSTNFKKIERFSPYFKRRTLGEKGLGRLSIQRLGHFMRVDTCPRIERLKDFPNICSKEDLQYYIEFNTYNLELNWRKFEKSDADISDIKGIFQAYNYEKLHFGTRLIIQGIRNTDFWNTKGLEKRIQTEIFSLINPFIQNKKQRFHILLSSDGVQFSNEGIDEMLLGLISDIKVEFSLKDWILNMKILNKQKYYQRIIDDRIKKMKDAGFDRYEMRKEYEDDVIEFEIDLRSINKLPKFSFIDILKLQKDSSGNFAYPGDFTGSFFVLEQSPKALNTAKDAIDLNDATFSSALKYVKSLWSSAVGVYLFRNDFRILPYGPDHDWLDFTKRSQRDKANSYKSHTVAGYFQLDGLSSENLREQTNRQGLIMDEYGTNFIIFAREVISEICFKVDVNLRGKFKIPSDQIEKSNAIETFDHGIVFYRTKKSDESKQKVFQAAEIIANDLINKVDERVKTQAAQLIQKFDEIRILFTEEQSEHKQEKFIRDKQIENLKAMAGLAGQAIVVESLTHELNRIHNNIGDYARQSKKLLQNSNNQAQNVITYQDMILSEVDYFKQHLIHLEPTYRKNKLSLTQIDIKSLLLELYEFTSPMAKKAKSLDIKVTITGETFQVYANKGVLITIFDNLFLNSLYWVDVNQESLDKTIYFNINKNTTSVTVWDSGYGVHNQIENKLFEPYESMKPDGRGLGLYIIKELMNSLHGIILLDRSKRNCFGNAYMFTLTFSEIDT